MNEYQIITLICATCIIVISIIAAKFSVDANEWEERANTAAVKLVFEVKRNINLVKEVEELRRALSTMTRKKESVDEALADCKRIVEERSYRRDKKTGRFVSKRGA